MWFYATMLVYKHGKTAIKIFSLFSSLQILPFVPIFLISVRKCTLFSQHNSLCSEAPIFPKIMLAKSTKAYIHEGNHTRELLEVVQ